MARLKAPRSISKREELRKDAATTFIARLQVLYVDNSRMFTYVGIGVVVAVFGYIGIRYLQGVRAEQAEEALGMIIFSYESGDYREALDGTATAIGLTEIVDRYGSTPAGRLAHFYAGDALFRLGEVDAAGDMFDGVSGGDNIIGASALAGEAAQLQMEGDLDGAARLYARAASKDESGIWAPAYLMSAARAYEDAGDFDEAEETLLELQEEFGDVVSEDELAFVLARVRSLQRRADAAS